MSLILGIETSCDDAGIAVYDAAQQRLLGHALYSQIKMHEQYGGVVPELASRSQLEKITGVLDLALERANVRLDQIDTIAVTNRPGLVGSLLVGICFAKGIAWAMDKKIIGIDHLEGHIFSSFLNSDGSTKQDVRFPFITLSASGGHTALYLVHDFGSYEIIGQTLDDAAGEAFDKIAKMLGFGYPGGATIERLARDVGFQDFFNYPRTKSTLDNIHFSFSGLKTAVLYDLVKKGVYDLHKGPRADAMSLEIQQQVASSLLVCIGDIFAKNVQLAFKRYPAITSLAFVGGVACNAYLRTRLQDLCNQQKKYFFAAPPAFCSDNGAMIAFVGSYKATQGRFSTLSLDVLRDG